MEPAILALKLVPLLLNCSIAPGLLAVGRLRWSPLEKLCGGVAASFILTYLASFALFVSGAGPWAYCGVSIAFLIMGAIGFRQLVIFFKNHQTRRVLIAFAIVLAWDFLHLAMVRSYSGGSWAGDWREHYERTRFFLHQHPRNYLFLTLYALPARPPMMNLLCAFFCRQAAGDVQSGKFFDAYQLCCMFFNAFAFLPCALLLRHLSPRGGRRVGILAVLFMLNPSIMANVTWTITKAFAAGFVVLAICFYLRAMRQKRGSSTRPSTRLLAVALSLAAAILIHYSAAPFALAIALHYLWTLIRQRRGFLEPAIAGLAATALLLTWFGWSMAVYGEHVTFFSNTTATGTAAKTPAENLHKMLLNGFTSLVPHPFHTVADGLIPAIHNWGDFRDYFFMMYQTTLPMMIGSAGGIVALYLFLTRKPPLASERRFWIFLVIFTFIVATAANPDLERYGAGHIGLQPLALIGVALVAAWLPTLRGWIIGLTILGTALDYSAGVLLQFDRESYVHPFIIDANHGLHFTWDVTIGGVGLNEYKAKILHGYAFWGDHFADASGLLETSSIILALLALGYLLNSCRRKQRSVRPRKPTRTNQ